MVLTLPASSASKTPAVERSISPEFSPNHQSPGGNAALCAALTAAGRGARVIVVERGPEQFRGGNSRHTRNLRYMHTAPTDMLTDAYPEDEFMADLLRVTGGATNETLARMMIRASADVPRRMRRFGVRFQPSLRGTLHLGRTNAFFLGGGKALLNSASTPRLSGSASRRVRSGGHRARAFATGISNRRRWKADGSTAIARGRSSSPRRRLRIESRVA